MTLCGALIYVVVRCVSVVGWIFDEILYGLERAYLALEKNWVHILSNTYVFIAYLSAFTAWICVEVFYTLHLKTGLWIDVGIYLAIYGTYYVAFSAKIDRDTYHSTDLEYDPDYGYGP